MIVVPASDADLAALAVSLRDSAGEIHVRLKNVDGLDVDLLIPLAVLLAHQHELDHAREHPSASEARLEAEFAKAANALRRVERALDALPRPRLLDLFRPGGRLWPSDAPEEGGWSDQASDAEHAQLRGWRERLERSPGLVPDTLLRAWDAGFPSSTRPAFSEWLVLLVAAVVRTRRPSGALDGAVVRGSSRRTGWCDVADVARVVIPTQLLSSSCKAYEDRAKTRLETDIGPRALALHIDGAALIGRYAALAALMSE